MHEVSDTVFWLCIVGGGLVLLLLAASVRRVRDGEWTMGGSWAPPRQEREREEEEEAPRAWSCSACGDPATEAMPTIVRSRGASDWFRELFALPPKYRRAVRGGSPALCRSHAHVADAMVEEFLHNRVRGAFAGAYTRVAVEAAGFEKEFLSKQIAESLTDEQKKVQKRTGANVTRLVRNGTEP